MSGPSLENEPNGRGRFVKHGGAINGMREAVMGQSGRSKVSVVEFLRYDCHISFGKRAGSRLSTTSLLVWQK